MPTYSQLALGLLRRLHTIDSSKRTTVLRDAPIRIILQIAEVCYNILKGTFPFTEEEVKHLEQLAAPIRLLADRTVPIAEKRKILANTDVLHTIIKFTRRFLE
jgi:hypothetical protein